MALTLQECIDKIKKEYPNHYPHTYVEFEHKYVFNFVTKGQDPETAISDMHVVDPKDGSITGGISIMEFLKDKKFREVWKHANLVANHDESLNHSSIPIPFDERGWRVRRNQNGNSLCHHGIKGQSWGVRNGPPYPLDQKTHNKVVKDRPTNNLYRKNTFRGMGPLKDVSSEETSSGPKGNDKLKKAAIATASVLSIIAVGAIVLKNPKVQEAIKTSAQNKFDQLNKELSDELISDIANVGKQYSSDNPPIKINGEHSVEDDMAACNPKYYGGFLPQTSNNCVLCSYTYDLRRRGYDVTALCSGTGNVPDLLAKRLYDDPKVESVKGKNFAEVYDSIAKKYPEGSRGEITVSGSNMAHAMAWEIRNGKLDVIDAQRNVRVSADEIEKLGFVARKTKMIRLDNLKVNYEGINSVSAEYKRPSANNSPLSESQRRRNYEKEYLDEHPNADRASAGLKNWVDSRMNADT